MHQVVFFTSLTAESTTNQANAWLSQNKNVKVISTAAEAAFVPTEGIHHTLYITYCH